MNSVSRRIAVLLAIVAILAIAATLTWPYLSVLVNRSEMTALITDAGPLGPLVYMALQVLQIVVAPIPGTVITIVGGFVFGTFWSTVYSMIGTTVGFLIVFLLSKRFGRKLLRYFLSKDKMNRYDDVAEGKGALAFIIIGFLFPVIPDPVIGYIAGLTPLRIIPLLALSIVTRIPGILITSFVGSSASEGEYLTVFITLAILALVLLLAYIHHGKLYTLINRLHDWALTSPSKRSTTGSDSDAADKH